MEENIEEFYSDIQLLEGSHSVYEQNGAIRDYMYTYERINTQLIGDYFCIQMVLFDNYGNKINKTQDVNITLAFNINGNISEYMLIGILFTQWKYPKYWALYKYCVQ